MADITLADVVKRLRAEGDLNRNSGTHSIKSLKKILTDQSKMSMDEKEAARESSRAEKKQLQLLSKGSGGDDVSGGPAGSKRGGLAKMAGGLLSGIGIGGGALAAGVGIMAAGGGYLLNEIGEMDADGIVKKVTTLLSIGDSFKGGNWEVLKDGGSFMLAMTGIGIGLAAFSIGAGVAAAIETFTKDSTFATTIKTQVKELLSIADFVAGDSGVLANLAFVGKSATFLLAMTGIGVGLAVFGAGSAAALAADFISTEGWAQRIKDSVVTLMSIEEAVGGEKGSSFVGESARFLLAMTGISAGLLAFGFGSTVATTSQSLAKFTGTEDWAETIKKNITTLMSIEDSLGGKKAAFGETGTFLAIMTGVAAGLTAFGFGSGTVALVETLNKFTGNENWAQKIKDQVKTLVSITDGIDGDSETSKAGKFASGLAKISLGLAAFGVGNAFGHLVGAASSILEMFGVESPFTQIMKISEEADSLTKGANALTKISKALDTFAKIKISDVQLDFKELAVSLADALPFLTALSNGGSIDASWWPTGDTSFGPKGEGGLLNPNLRLDELSAAIQKINYVLSGGTTPVPINESQLKLSATNLSNKVGQVGSITAAAVGTASDNSGSTIIAPSSNNSDSSVKQSNETTIINNVPRARYNKMGSANESWGPMSYLE